MLALALIVPVVSALNFAPSCVVKTVSVTQTVWVDKDSVPYSTQAPWIKAEASAEKAHQPATYTIVHNKDCTAGETVTWDGQTKVLAHPTQLQVTEMKTWNGDVHQKGWPATWTEMYTSLSTCTPGQTVTRPGSPYPHTYVLESTSTSTCTITATHHGVPTYPSGSQSSHAGGDKSAHYDASPAAASSHAVDYAHESGSDHGHGSHQQSSVMHPHVSDSTPTGFPSFHHFANSSLPVQTKHTSVSLQQASWSRAVGSPMVTHSSAVAASLHSASEPGSSSLASHYQSSQSVPMGISGSVSHSSYVLSGASSATHLSSAHVSSAVSSSSVIPSPSAGPAPQNPCPEGTVYNIRSSAGYLADDSLLFQIQSTNAHTAAKYEFFRDTGDICRLRLVGTNNYLISRFSNLAGVTEEGMSGSLAQIGRQGMDLNPDGWSMWGWTCAASKVADDLVLSCHPDNFPNVDTVGYYNAEYSYRIIKLPKPMMFSAVTLTLVEPTPPPPPPADCPVGIVYTLQPTLFADSQLNIIVESQYEAGQFEFWDDNGVCRLRVFGTTDTAIVIYDVAEGPDSLQTGKHRVTMGQPGQLLDQPEKAALLLTCTSPRTPYPQASCFVDDYPLVSKMSVVGTELMIVDVYDDSNPNLVSLAEYIPRAGCYQGRFRILHKTFAESGQALYTFAQLSTALVDEPYLVINGNDYWTAEIFRFEWEASSNKCRVQHRSTGKMLVQYYDPSVEDMAGHLLHFGELGVVPAAYAGFQQVQLQCEYGSVVDEDVERREAFTCVVDGHPELSVFQIVPEEDGALKMLPQAMAGAQGVVKLNAREDN